MEQLHGLGGHRIAIELSMASAGIHAMALPVPTPPAGIDLHYETENRVVWNDKERTNEEHEFVYEVSWVAELGAWRRFLRSHRKA